MLLIVVFLAIFLGLLPLPEQVFFQLGLQASLLINQLLHERYLLLQVLLTDVLALWRCWRLMLGRLSRLDAVTDLAGRRLPIVLLLLLH